MRTARAAYSFLAASVGTVLTIVLGMVATPILLNLLGPERIGAFRATSDWYGYLALFDLGVGGALLAMLNRASTKGAQAERVVLLLGLNVYQKVAACSLLVGVILAVVSPWLVPVEASLRSELLWTASILAVCSLGVAFTPIRLYFEATQSGYLTATLLIAQAIVIPVVSIAMAWVGLGIASQAIGVLAGALVFAVGLVAIGRVSHPDLTKQIVRKTETREGMDELRAQSRPFLWNRLSGQVALLSDNLIVAFFLGPTAVAQFFLTQRLISVSFSQISSVGNVTWAGLADLHHRGEAAAVRGRIVETTKIVSLLGMALLAPVAALNERFVTLWVGPELYAGTAVTLLASVAVMFRAILSQWSWVLGGAGFVKATVPCNAVGAALNLFVSLLATWHYGMIGPLLGTVAANVLLQTIWIAILLGRCFQVSLTSLALACALPIPIGLTVFTLLTWINHVHPAGWILLIFELAASAAAILAFSWPFILTGDERRLWRARASAWRSSRYAAHSGK